MNIKTKKSLLATFVAVFGAGAVSSGVMAQGGNESATSQARLDEIVVTAQKREQNIQEVPMSIAAISGDEISSRGIDGILELASAVPGLDIHESGISRRVYLRGMGNVAGTEALVGMYIDDTSVTTVAGRAIAIQLYDLERVEVLRGPQGTLYGAGAMGGAIRFITRDPELEGFNGKADISTSFVNGGDSGYEAKGVLNVPLIDDVLGLRLSGIYSKAGGWMDQSAISRENINDPELAHFRVKALWQPTDVFDAKLMATIHRNNAGAPTVGLDENGDYTQSPVAPLTTPSFEDDYDIYNLALSYDFDGMNLLSSTSYLETTTDIETWGRDLYFAVPPWSVFVNAVAEVVVFTQELRLASDNSGAFSWVVGGYYRDARNSDEGTNDVDFRGGGAIANIAFKTDTISESWAVFGDLNYELTDRLNVGVGMRYFEDDREFYDGSVTQTGAFDAVSPRFYGGYELTDNINLYTNIGKGFRSGGFNRLNQPAYEPEVAWSYEVGSKMQLWDGMLSTDLALFYTEYTDYQDRGILPPPSPPLSITNNLGEAEVTGVDLAIMWRPTQQLTLGLNGTYVNAELTKASGTGQGRLNVGDELNQIPNYGVSLSANYEFNWLNGTPGFARLDYSEKGHAYNRNRGTIDEYSTRSDIVSMLNARIGATKDDWRFELFAQNILDDNGLLDGNFGAGNAARPQPRTVGLSVGRDF